MSDIVVTDKEIQKEYKKAVIMLITGIICLLIGLILFMFFPIGGIGGFIAIVTVLALAIALLLMGLIRMIQCKKSPEWVRKMLAKRKKKKAK